LAKSFIGHAPYIGKEEYPPQAKTESLVASQNAADCSGLEPISEESSISSRTKLDNVTENFIQPAIHKSALWHKRRT
jgi:hypothetical protein